MAKQTNPQQTTSKVATFAPLMPKATDKRAELFFLLGHIRGLNIDSASRITELVIDLTSNAALLDTSEVTTDAR